MQMNVWLGPWSKEEEEQLTAIVTDMTIKQGKDIDNDVFWGKVSELMGGRRGRQQCRIKWWDLQPIHFYTPLIFIPGPTLSVRQSKMKARSRVGASKTRSSWCISQSDVFRAFWFLTL
jgi:hypothetical protein